MAGVQTKVNRPPITTLAVDAAAAQVVQYVGDTDVVAIQINEDVGAAGTYSVEFTLDDAEKSPSTTKLAVVEDLDVVVPPTGSVAKIHHLVNLSVNFVRVNTASGPLVGTIDVKFGKALP